MRSAAKILVSVTLPLFLASFIYPQSEDSLLLQKISGIDVSLVSPEDIDEDLFIPSVSFQTFYDELSPAGEWIQITKEEIDGELNDGEGQGIAYFTDGNKSMVFIWRPVNIDASWRPYTNGKWVYTEHGWMWTSNYSWGWAVYNYGRWWKSGTYGWCWIPGYVWAPAWVAWSVSENHVGWCPLSPKAKWKGSEGITESVYKVRNEDADWVFVDKSRFVDDINSSSIVGPKENSALVSNSKVMVDMKVENNMIVSKGPDVADIEKRTGRPVQKRGIKVMRERKQAMVGSSDVTLYRENFKKLSVDAATGKYKNIDKPKKFKRSPKAKKIYNKMKYKRGPYRGNR